MRTPTDRNADLSSVLRARSRSPLAAGLLGLGLVSASAALAQPLGALSQLPGTDGCVSNDGTSGDCTDGVALATVADVVMSPDGKHVYVGAASSNGVAAFKRQ